MIRFILIGLVAGCAVGCSSDPPPLDMAATPDGAKAVVIQALDAWKGGAKQADLSARTPPIYLNDDDLVRGRTLTGYKLEGEPVPSGIGMRVEVTLTLDGGGKPPATRKIPYRVVLTPNISIAREDR